MEEKFSIKNYAKRIGTLGKLELKIIENRQCDILFPKMVCKW